jgi:HK97 family phage major capsid protein
MPAGTLARPDDLRRRFRDASTRRALSELREDTAAAIRQVAEDGTDADTGGMSEASQSLFDALKTLLTEIDAKVSRQATIDDIDQRSARRDRADRSFDASLYEYSIRGMILASLGKAPPGLDLGRSMEIAAELRSRPGRAFQGVPCPIEALSLRASYARGLERRVITSGLPASGPGSNLIATTLDASRYIDSLRARTVVRQAGAQVISGLVGNLDLPRMKQTAQVSWFAEGSNIARSDEAFDHVSFRPKHCGAIVAYSINMLLQSTPDIEMIIRDDLSRLLALDLDRVALTGSGQGAEPLGIIRNPLVTKIAATDFEYLNAVAMRAALSGKNVPLESLAFIGNSKVDAWSLSALDAMSRPLGKSIVYLGSPDYVSNVCTAAAVTGPPALAAVANPLILGAWSDLFITFYRELDLRASDQVQTAWDTGGVEVRAIMDADVNVRHPESFVFQDVQTGPTLPPLVTPTGATTQRRAT